MKKALIIYNPSAGINTKSDIGAMVINHLHKIGFEADLFYLDSDFEKNISGYDFFKINLIVAIGGDGTVKVAGRTIVQNKLEIPLAIIPYGSANVIASSLRIPLNTKGALKLIEVGKQNKIDLGLINNSKYFIVGLSQGYISKVVTGTSTKLKNKFGSISYLINFIFGKIQIKRTKYKIEVNNKIFWLKGNSLVIFNACNFYGLTAKKNISITDGILNLYVVTNRNFFNLIKAGIYLIFFHEKTKLLFNLEGSHFKITLKNKSNSCQIDGDWVDLPRTIDIKILPKILSVYSGQTRLR
ncbi:MAG: diacylglycerol kinase family protein [Patescibacteria group bacterium]|jgi:diacylglycerol kinase family enzyme